MQKTEMTNLTIRLPLDLKADFELALEKNDDTASQVLRRAIRAYLGGNEIRGAISSKPQSFNTLASKSSASVTDEVASANEHRVDDEASSGPASSTALDGIRAMIGWDQQSEV